MSVVDNDRAERRQMNRDEDLVPTLVESVWRARMRHITDPVEASEFVIHAIQRELEAEQSDEMFAHHARGIMAAYRWWLDA